MKSKMLFFGFLLVVSLLFVYFTLTGANSAEGNKINAALTQTTNGGLDKFYIGAINDEGDNFYSTPYSQIDNLGFNLWQWYGQSYRNTGTNQWEPAGFLSDGCDIDYLNTAVYEYKVQVNQKINAIYSHNNRKLVIMRPKILWLSYGQRSDYKCADLSYLDQNLWFYTFQSPGHIGQDEQDYDNGLTWVRHCRQINSTNQGSWIDNPGTVVSKLRANSEQCNRDTNVVSCDNNWEADSQWDWYINPRIKADQNWVNNHSDEPVCRIDVFNAGGNIFKSVLIRARNFPNYPQYNGSYFEEFNFNPLTDSLLNNYHGDWATGIGQWWWNARGNQTSESEYNLADIQVYWYGQCDMWINYVRVDNEIADGLLNPNSSKYNLYNGWIDS